MIEKNNKLKVVTVMGTRPEIIRLSRIISLLDKNLNHILIHTGQNYDYELNEIFFKELGIRKPDYFLNIDTSSLGKVLGETLIKSETVFLKENPDALLILGDTNSSIAAIIAKRMKIPIYHMEAGNRCFDNEVPEEINRKIIDHISDINLVYTEKARQNLISEGLHQKKIYLSGSPLFEVLNYYKNEIDKSKIIIKLKLKTKDYFLFSFHREENIEQINNLKSIVAILNAIAEKYNKSIIVSTHPRTNKKLKSINLKVDKRVKFLKPFGFFDYVFLQKNAICTISDSGTISEESAILSFPAITIRNAIERQEAIDAGTIIMTGLEVETVLNSLNIAIEEKYDKRKIPLEYTIDNTSLRVLKLIVGTAKIKWIRD